MHEMTKKPVNPEDEQVSLNDAVRKFERENPVLAEALHVMNISYKEYLGALSSLQKASSSTTNSTKITL